jgi:hypothetical protein
MHLPFSSRTRVALGSMFAGAPCTEVFATAPCTECSFFSLVASFLQSYHALFSVFFSEATATPIFSSFNQYSLPKKK